jgi:hypothetical protein
MTEPLSVAGGLKEMVACALPAVTTWGFKGALGTPTVIAAEDALSTPYPAKFRASATNVYEVPLVSPLTVMGGSNPVAKRPSGVLITMYSKMAFPPLEGGGWKVTVASPFPGTAVTAVGALGVVNGVAWLEAADGELVPREFVAVTVNV